MSRPIYQKRDGYCPTCEINIKGKRCRKCGAVFGRFDVRTRRKKEKSITLPKVHEVLPNNREKARRVLDVPTQRENKRIKLGGSERPFLFGAKEKKK